MTGQNEKKTRTARETGFGDLLTKTFEPARLISGPALPDGLAHHFKHIPWIPLPIASPVHDGPTKDIVLFVDMPRGRFPLCWRAKGQLIWASQPDQWLGHILNERYRPRHKPSLARLLPFHYHALPAWLRKTVAATLLGNRKPSSPGFEDMVFGGGVELINSLLHPEDTQDTPVAVLTHDVDTRHGFDGINRLAALEERYGFTSSWNVVPNSYPLDMPLLRTLKNAGHEIGLHGLTHDNSEAFLGTDALKKAFMQLADIRADLDIRGYRGPSWYRTPEMFDALKECFEYDSTCLDSDRVCPGGKGGVGLCRPFPIRPGLIEIPCTLPYEAPLLRRVPPSGLLDKWRDKLDFLELVKGYAVVNTHPDRGYAHDDGLLLSYEMLLRELRSRDFSPMLPRQIVERTL